MKYLCSLKFAIAWYNEVSKYPYGSGLARVCSAICLSHEEVSVQFDIPNWGE